MLIVPGLFYLFDLIQLPQDSLMHMAAGSSMCIMIFTAASSTWAHHRQEHIQWSIVRKIMAGIAVGVISGNLLANRMPTQILELIFGIFLLVVSTKIFFEKKSEEEEQTVGTPGIVATSAVGMVIGFKSGILGIGGGALSVPFLLYCGLPMKKASGTSASFTLPIAIVGTLSFLLLSGNQTAIPWSTGYVYWPAVLLVAPFTMLGAPLGAKFAGIIASENLRAIFAGLLLFISLRMLSGTGLNLWDLPLV